MFFKTTSNSIITKINPSFSSILAEHFFRSFSIIFEQKIEILKFSLTKTKADTSLPIHKQELVLIYAEDIAVMPVPNERGILTVDQIQIKEGAEMYTLYLTPSLQEDSAEEDGDFLSKGWIQSISGSFPGTRLEAVEWLKNNINSAFVVVEKNCGGMSRIYGSKYNPMLVSATINDTSESSTCDITLATVKKTKRPFLVYNGEYSGETSDCECVLLIDLL